MIEPKTILVCEDDLDSCELLRFVFELEGYEVTICNKPDEYLSLIRDNQFLALMLDNRIGAVSSVETCRQIKTECPKLPVIFYSGEARQTEIAKALGAGASAYLIKPLDFDKLVETVTELIRDFFN